MIRIKETHQTKDAPYADAFQVWILWEILTPDPLSQQVVFRKQYNVHFKNKPMVWKAIRSAVGEKQATFNEKLPYFF